MKYKLLMQAMRLLKPLSKLYNSVKGILPKRRKKDDLQDLRDEIAALKTDLEKHTKNIEKETEKVIKKKVIKQKRKEWIQAEMYVSVVTSGQDSGSEAGGYILINVDSEEYEKVKQKFHGMKVEKLKQLLGLPENKVVKNVSHGSALGTIEEEFTEINGQRKNYDRSMF